MATAAGSTHPTGMHSWLKFVVTNHQTQRSTCFCGYFQSFRPKIWLLIELIIWRKFHNSVTCTSIFQLDFDVNYQIANATESSVIFRNVASSFSSI